MRGNQDMRTETAALIRRAKRYAKAAKIAESSASLRIFNSGARLKDIQAGSRVWPDTIAAANAKLDELEKELAT
jgi:DNA-binding sugar fermentation-stimulating protein